MRSVWSGSAAVGLLTLIAASSTPLPAQEAPRTLGDADLAWSTEEAEPALLDRGAPYRYGLAPKSRFHAPVGYDRASGRVARVRGMPADARVLPAPQALAIDELAEGFDDITQLPGAGWGLINNSEPLGPSSWFQGNETIFPAHEGDPDAYIAANYESTDDVGTISNWLITPEVTIGNGTTITFWTRKAEQFGEFADRLEVRMSVAGASTDVGDTAESVGAFKELMLTINPDLVPGEYPQEWTQFTLTVRERSRKPVTGRFAFRYWVTDAGPNGSNADYIGIDTVSVTQPGGGGNPPVELLASDGAEGDRFGWRVALEGHTALVGAYLADTNDRPDEGAAYVFQRDPMSGVWTEAAKLTTPCDTVVVQICGFGTSVALAGDTALIGAPDADPDGNASQGAAYVFARDPSSGEWVEQAKLVASDGAELDQFGIEVALADGVALVGAPFATVDGVLGRGAAYVFERDPLNGAWVERAKFTNADGDEFDNFGAAVALSGDTALVGEPFVAVGENAIQGVVHVFARDGAGSWPRQALLVASDGAFADDFGAAVALSDDVALIGARSVDVGDNPDQGAAYIFTRNPGSGAWTEQTKLIAAAGASWDFFASHLGLSNGTAVIGAPSAAMGTGIAHVFKRNQKRDTWREIARLDPPAPVPGAAFGTVATAGRFALIGSPDAAVNGNLAQGAAYLFDRRRGQADRLHRSSGGDRHHPHPPDDPAGAGRDAPVARSAGPAAGPPIRPTASQRGLTAGHGTKGRPMGGQ